MSNQPSSREEVETAINTALNNYFGPGRHVNYVTPDILAVVDAHVERVIGADENAGSFSDGQKCPDCGEPDQRFARNQLRVEQRQLAGLTDSRGSEE